MDMESRIIESFRRVKTDILTLQQKLTELSQEQERILKIVADTREKETVLYNQVKDIECPPPKVITKPKKEKFVGSKTGTKVHIASCPFAKNISPKNRVEFGSKNAALNKGYKACNCMKKY